MTTVYLQIAHELRGRIISGDIASGEKVPSTREIQLRYKVASATASKALKVLVDEGLCEAKPGVGTIVRANQPIYRRAEDRLRAGSTTGLFMSHGERSVIVDASITTIVPAGVRADLDLQDGDPAIRRHRIISRDGIPVEACTSWFDAKLLAVVAPLLVNKERIDGGTSAYICRQLGREVTHGIERQSVRLATDEEAQELELPTPLPVLVTEHVASIGDQPICSDVGVCPPGYTTVRTYELG